MSLPTWQSKQEDFVEEGEGQIQDVGHRMPVKSYGIQVKATGTVTKWTVLLKGSLNGTGFDEILKHTEQVGDDKVMWSGMHFCPAFFFRAEVVDFVSSDPDAKLTVDILGST